MDMGKFLKTALPWIGAAATGNVPALVSLAATTVSNQLGKSVDATADSIATAVAGATPDQIIALRQADNDLKEKMQAMNFQSVEDLEKIAADDRANARARQATLKDQIPAILAIGITLGFFGLLAAMLKLAIPSSSEKIIDIMVGSLGTAWVSVVAYYFGSSAAHDAMTANK